MSIYETYLKHYGLKVVGDQNKGFEILLAPCILDVMQQIFYKEVVPINFKQEQKQYCNNIKKAYKSFNKEFWGLFSQEQIDEIIEYMDEFTSMLQENVISIRQHIEEPVTDMTDEELHRFSAIDCCHILATVADKIYMRAFRNIKSMRNGDRNIKSIAFNSCKLFCEYFRHHSGMHVIQDDSIDLVSSVDNLVKNIVDFLKYLEKKKIPA